jgi:hypothetical protein
VELPPTRVELESSLLSHPSQQLCVDAFGGSDDEAELLASDQQPLQGSPELSAHADLKAFASSVRPHVAVAAPSSVPPDLTLSPSVLARPPPQHRDKVEDDMYLHKQHALWLANQRPTVADAALRMMSLTARPSPPAGPFLDTAQNQSQKQVQPRGGSLLSAMLDHNQLPPSASAKPLHTSRPHTATAKSVYVQSIRPFSSSAQLTVNPRTCFL